MDRANFRAGRFFFHAFTNGQSSGWFFNAREGAFGPYRTKLEAQFELELFIQRCIEEQKTGGRLAEIAEVANDIVEEIVAAPPPEEMTPESMSYFDKMRAAVRERTSRYLGNFE